MKTVISFNEGCSGHFLAALLTNSDITVRSRIDTTDNFQSLKDANVYCAVKLTDRVHRHDYTVAVTHEKNYEVIQQQLAPDRVIRIEPVTGIFTAIYNVYFKKLINEDNPELLDNWMLTPALHYDRAYEHLRDYYAYFSQSHWYPQEILFDFGWLFNDLKLKEFAQYIKADINFDLVHAYRAKQLPWLLSHPTSTSMTEIVDQFPPDIFHTGPWFASYCIFCYEQANCIQESQRTWSINNLGLLTRNELIKLAQCYRL